MRALQFALRAAYKFGGSGILRLKLLRELNVQVSDTTEADWKTDAGDQK